MQLAALLIWLAAFAVLGGTALTSGGRQAIASLVADVFGWIMWFTARVAPTVAVQFAKGLVRAFENDRETWAQVVQVFTDEITSIVGPGGDVSAPTVGGATGHAADIARPLSEAVLKGIAPSGELTPESGTANLETLLGLTFALGLQGWWVEVVGDLVSLGKFGAAADLPDAIERSLGLNRLGRLAWRTPIKKAIQEPLEELYNRRYQFKKLTVGEGHQAWHRGLIGDEEYIQIAQAAGYSHDRAAILLDLAKQPYSTAEIVELSKLLDIGDDQLVPLLRELGYDENRARVILDLGRARVTQKYLDELVTKARESFLRGDLTVDQLTNILAEAHLSDREIKIVIAMEALTKSTVKSLTTAELLSAYKEGVLTPLAVREDLRRLGYVDDDIDVLLALQHRVLSVAQILDLLTRGRLTLEEAARRLEAEGYSPADATLLTSLRARRLTEGQVLDALRVGLINAQQATADLTVLGFDQDQVLILLAFFRKALSPADVQAAVVRGLLTPEQALARLIDQGYSAADAEIIVALDRRLLTVGQTLDAFAAGILTREEVLGDLAARGYSQDDAHTLLRVFELHKEQQAAKAATPPGGAPGAPAPPRPPSVRRRRRVTPPPPAPGP